ncbi:MAG: FAD/NAD(P)-binding protein [Betaproteobacteria bacterium]|nr:FAD/NAD(P)-binding protein [Betaproteobacteria bacterium]
MFSINAGGNSSIVIVGVGPRGLGILERLHAHCLSGTLPENLVLHLVDPVGGGAGAVWAEQPDYLLSNTVAGQVTIFADRTVKNAGPILVGPTLAQWANVDPNTYLPRTMLGRYMRFAYRYFVDMLSASITVHEHRCSAVAVKRLSSGGYEVKLERGAPLSADYLFLCTGHGHNRLDEREQTTLDWAAKAVERNPLARYFPRCYPVQMLDAIESHARVAVRGMGLSANDIVAALTTGRGGAFFRTKHGQLRYVVSGREPAIYVFSRTSIPFSARAINQKGVDGQHQAVFFTREAVDHARERCGQRQIDFRRDLLPLLIREMVLVMRGARGEETASLIANGPRADEVAAVKQLFETPHADEFNDMEAYSAHVIRSMQEDLAAALRGNIDDPIKAATDVIRDVRDNLRYAIEQSGLTPASYREFLSQFIPAMNRIAVGPPMSRVEEWCALMDAGVLQLAGGPGAALVFDDTTGCFTIHTRFKRSEYIVAADVLVDARIEPASITLDESPLLRSMCGAGLIRAYSNGGIAPGGIDIDENNHPLDANGTPLRNIWVLGNPTEGANFYTYILPRPMVNSRFIQDAGRAVVQVLDSVRAKHSAQATSPVL